MKNFFFLVLLALMLASCGSSKNRTATTTDIIGKVNSEAKQGEYGKMKGNNKLGVATDSKRAKAKEAKNTKDNIIDYAKTFEGTRYKFGGTTKKGMDCSGLVFIAFKTEDITLPRISRDMAKKGILISFKDIQEGDLVFFKTNPNKKAINHVGLVVESRRGEVKFIHATTRAGVIISDLDEKYWKNAFVEVRRII